MAASQVSKTIVYLSSSDKSEKINPPSKLLCNWRQCTYGPKGGPAIAERLCPFCHRVGYCCKMCLEQDIYAHVSHECAKNRKDPILQEVVY